MQTRPQPLSARLRLVLLTVLTALAALLSPALHASASGLPAAETRVGDSTLAAPDVDGVAEHIAAGQRRSRAPSQLRLVSGHCVAAEDGLMAGSGPGRGVLEVSSQVRSTAAVRNFNPGSSREFVFDPSRERFVVGRSEKGFGHYGLAQEIGADENTVVGGMLSRGPDGEFFTNEMSGHYGSNWTDPVRQQFVDFMRGYGFDIEHAMWGAGG
jgi:hypothetical protein